jgi:hypothetical protein
MRTLTVTLLLSLLTASSAFYEPEPDSINPFDRYGAILWEDEKARLDNFAIHLQQTDKSLGYILVFDKTGGCPGEATARAIRAKRYLVEHRGVPWNRVVWRREGDEEDIRTTLWIVPAGATAFFLNDDTTVPSVNGRATRACRNKLQKIKRSRW